MGKGGPPAPLAVSPGGIQRYMSAETSMSENGQGSFRQAATVRTSLSTPVTQPKKVGSNPQGSSKAQNGEQKMRGGAEEEPEENLKLEGIQASLP